MTKVKEDKRKKEEPIRGEVHFIVPARNKGFPSDARALDAIFEINQEKHLDAVASDQGQTYSLVYRFCVENEIDFISRGQDITQDPSCLDELLSMYQKRAVYEPQKTSPKIAYLTHSNNCKTLSAVAENLAVRGVKTEIRKVF